MVNKLFLRAQTHSPTVICMDIMQSVYEFSVPYLYKTELQIEEAFSKLELPHS